MKIGLVRRGFSPTGGAEAYLKRLGRALVDAGHRPRLYCTREWPAAEWPHGPVTTLAHGGPLAFAHELQERACPEEVLFSLERVLACDCYRAGDGIHAGWLELRRPHEPSWRHQLRRFNRKHTETVRLEQSLLGQRRALHVIANSELVKRQIVDAYAYPADQVTVVYNGLPDFHFQKRPGTRRELRNRWNIRENELALLFAGSGWFRKGLRYAIRALQQLKDPRVRLLVAGAGRKPRFAPPQVRFLGAVTEMESLYRAADLFVLPTIYDPFSNACLEALSFGLPVVTTAANGVAEVMQPGVHGEVVTNAADVPRLASALAAWLDPARREQAEAACIALARNFSMDRNLQQTLSVLQRVQPPAMRPP
ncbi:MAG TPA: glycosyltransferase family 4 protein [Chthoniobacterales bacterium]